MSLTRSFSLPRKAIERDDARRWLDWRMMWGEIAAAFARKCLYKLEEEYAIARRTPAMNAPAFQDGWQNQLARARHVEQQSQRELVAIRGERK